MLVMKDLKKAMIKYYTLYNEYGKRIKVRPPARRLEGCNKEETFKFAILVNLMISFMLVLE